MIELRRMRAAVQRYGADFVMQKLQEAVRAKHASWRDFRIRDLAEALIVGSDKQPVGPEWVRQLGPQKSGGFTLMEAATGVDLSRFSNITGQIIYNRIMEGYQLEEFKCTGLVGEYQTDFNGEKIPGITGFVEDVQTVHEGMPFPEVGFGEDYVETPVTTKRGLICSVDKETIFFDRTNQVMKRAGEVGEILGRKKEKMCARGIMGLDNTYKWKGTSYNTYQTATPWINVISGATLTDWTSIDAVEQLFADMLEPNTSEPIVIDPKQILHMPAKRHAFRQIIKAVTLETRTSSSTIIRQGPNTLDPYELVESKFAYRALIASGVSAANAKNYWFMGDFKKAFAWQYNWPLTVVQAPNNHEAEFKQDIVLRWKASERGSFVVDNPRYVVKIYNA